MSTQEHSSPEPGQVNINNSSVESTEGNQKYKEYQQVLDHLNEHSAQTQEILRAMEEDEQRNATS